MFKDVLYNSKVLNGLFTEDDFAFLNGADSEMAELDSILKNQKVNREHIINFINSFEDTSAPNANDILTETQQIFELVNNNINDIYNLKEQFQQLEKMIVEAIVDLENGTPSAEDNINEIESKINSYSSKYKYVKNTILENDDKINNFLNKINITPESKIADRYTVVNINNLHADNLTADIEDNLDLIISENDKKVFLPYTKEEVLEFMKKYPNDYSSAQEVINQEFIVPISTYSKHPSLARFREAYSLIRDKEMKSIMDAFKYAIDLMFKYELNPAIIAACKSEKQLDEYLHCLETNNLENFKYFNIKFEISPFAVKNNDFSIK